MFICNIQTSIRREYNNGQLYWNLDDSETINFNNREEIIEHIATLKARYASDDPDESGSHWFQYGPIYVVLAETEITDEEIEATDAWRKYQIELALLHEAKRAAAEAWKTARIEIERREYTRLSQIYGEDK